MIQNYEYMGDDNMDSEYSKHIAIFKAISDETRLKILDILSCGEMCACDILEEFSISQSTLSHHMKILSECGLVNAVRDGAWMRYTLNRETIDDTMSFLKTTTSDKEDCVCKKYRGGC